MFIFELFSYSQKQKKETLHSKLFDPEILLPEAGKMDFITFWELLPGIDLVLLQSVYPFWEQKNISKIKKFN